MTATEKLRALLDERGVEYEAERIDSSNYFTWGENDCYSYTEYPDGTVLRIWDCTPEQAIAATLGSHERTCHETMVDKYFHGCDSCGYVWEAFYNFGKRERPKYCPNCGARVERREQ